ncbi:hypothetical protein EVAR_90630_1 [Eumeta japonica]|uniref:DUF5641 domain-containing protein n=1 Tax=Eumeta variegata TaxID=151549 RepID=A0A4C1ZQ24_EUMVA|nr:hypothetical protein EVAR_90630_1 [Eumeta japonica]
MARRGQPDTLYSDHGTNFVGAAAELSRARLEIEERMSDEATTRAIRWLRIPHTPRIWKLGTPGQVHKGGFERHTAYQSSERRSTTHTAARGRICCELSTAHTHIGPPETHGADPESFPVGSAAGRWQPGHFDTSEECSRKQWRASQALAEMFWQRWLREYSPRCRDVTSGQRGGHRSKSETRSSSPTPPYHVTRGRGASSNGSTQGSTGKCEWWTFARPMDG